MPPSVRLVLPQLRFHGLDPRIVPAHFQPEYGGGNALRAPGDTFGGIEYEPCEAEIARRARLANLLLEVGIVGVQVLGVHDKTDRTRYCMS